MQETDVALHDKKVAERKAYDANTGSSSLRKCVAKQRWWSRLQAHYFQYLENCAENTHDYYALRKVVVGRLSAASSSAMLTHGFAQLSLGWRVHL
jgi:hypothetical protein